MDTATFRGRFSNTSTALKDLALSTDTSKLPLIGETDPAVLLGRARATLAAPTLSPSTEQVLLRFAADSITTLAPIKWQKRTNPVLAENGLRQLILMSADFQTA
jgi:hypothetical protein